MQKVEIIEKAKTGFNFTDNDVTKYVFSLDIDRIDDMIKWLFDNTEDRFVMLGTNTLYFENKLDAVAFKLRWL